MTTSFARLFEPIRIGAQTIPNRLFVSAHHTYFVEPDPTGFRMLEIACSDTFVAAMAPQW